MFAQEWDDLTSSVKGTLFAMQKGVGPGGGGGEESVCSRLRWAGHDMGKSKDDSQVFGSYN